MRMCARGWARAGLLVVVAAMWAGEAGAQVFTVGEKTATSDIKTDFTATHVELPDAGMTERGRRELIRGLESEQGFAHRVLPLGSIVTLQANGNLTPGADGYKMMIYKKGQAAGPGDRVAVTSLKVTGDRIEIDLNGGPYPKHRFLRHLQIGVGGVATQDPDLTADPATGMRVLLVFEGGVPEVSAPEVKALLEPLIDFGVKTGEQAYADTLPAPVKNAISSHEVLVGMNHRMVLAALGQPESKLRETAEAGKYEEWIYGHQPQTVKFVRFMGDRVSLIKVAALGKPMEIHDRDEMAGFIAPPKFEVVDVKNGPVVGDEKGAAPAPPSLKLPGETATPAENKAETQRKVQYPSETRDPAVVPAQVPAVKPPSERLSSSASF